VEPRDLVSLLAMTAVVGLALTILLYVAFPHRGRVSRPVRRWTDAAAHVVDAAREHTISSLQAEPDPRQETAAAFEQVPQVRGGSAQGGDPGR
jgi:hypothetical protein